MVSSSIQLKERVQIMPFKGLTLKGGMVNSWNKLCFTGGYIEASVKLPGSNNVPGILTFPEESCSILTSMQVCGLRYGLSAIWGEQGKNQSRRHDVALVDIHKRAGMAPLSVRNFCLEIVLSDRRRLWRHMACGLIHTTLAMLVPWQIRL